MKSPSENSIEWPREMQAEISLTLAKSSTCRQPSVIIGNKRVVLNKALKSDPVFILDNEGGTTKV